MNKKKILIHGKHIQNNLFVFRKYTLVGEEKKDTIEQQNSKTLTIKIQLKLINPLISKNNQVKKTTKQKTVVGTTGTH